GLAATPGNSNHESGLAFDVEEYTTWKSALEAHGFAWFGSSDPVHYDYAGQGAVDHRGTDVLAFQQLWNKNHPGDTIAEDGQYGPATEARLQQSPAGGFPVGASCGGPPPDGPDVWPAISIDAPDRFTDGSSMGVADLFVGDTHTVTLDVLNKGGSPANPVELGVWIEEPFITATFYEIESDWQHQGQFTINEANDDPKNPPHDAPGQSFTLRIHQLSPNETKRVVLKIKASKYSIGKADSPDVRFWVKDIPNVYHQDQFGHAPTVSKGQTFNGGVLEAFEENDVYSHTEWAWNTDRLEGWTPSGDATLALTGTSALLLGSKGDDPGALGPSTSFSAVAFPKFRVRVKRTGGEGAATMYFATSADPELDEAKAVSFAIPDDDAFHAVDVDMTSNAKWTGTVTALRLDPFAKTMGSVELDFLRFEAGGQGGSSAASGGGAGRPTGGLDTGAGGGGAADAGDGTGCSCRVGPAEDHDAPLAASLALVSLALCRRKRRFFARLAFPRWPRRSNSS
ncbi:MAG TPA: M15 family metallopeptidase, partial [Minicystis sp.]|nr:M15 family metallopeptidase [Minicystis sp.]